MGLSEVTFRESTPRVMRASLAQIARSHTLRCDAKQAERRYQELDRLLSQIPNLTLGSVLPRPFIKGAQPVYSEELDGDGTPVISTMAIQGLSINVEACRLARQVDFGPANIRQPRLNDVLLTLDGGVSIGKPALFTFAETFAIDSHVAILRDVVIDPRLLVYLLASPIGQAQFQRAESGASGQTGVTEDDVRRFRFPSIEPGAAESAVADLEASRAEVRKAREAAQAQETEAWKQFVKATWASVNHQDS